MSATASVALTFVAWVFARALVAVGHWLDEREANRRRSLALGEAAENELKGIDKVWDKIVRFFVQMSRG